MTKKNISRKIASAGEPQKLKTILIQEAVKLLENKSANDISLREIARRAGVSQAAPYKHFKDKADLLAGIAEQGFGLLHAYLEQAAKTYSHKPEELFYEAALAYYKMGEKHKEHFKLMFGTCVTPSQAHPELFNAMKQCFLTLVKVVVVCQKAKVIGKSDPFHKAINLWMIVHGFITLVVDMRCDFLGINKINARQALRGLMSDYLNGGKSPLMPSGFQLEIQGLSVEILRELGLEAKLTYS
jgi:AcrR family transcriptional regulator